jgi:thioredoxin-related protein
MIRTTVRSALVLLLPFILAAADDAAPSPWREDMSAALAAAKGRPLAVLLSIPGCSWCVRMLDESSSSPEVRQALGEVVGLHLDAQQHPELAARLNIQGFPTLVLVNRRSQLVRILPGYLPPADLAAALRTLVAHGDADGQQAFDLAVEPDPEALAKEADGVQKLLALLGTGSPQLRIKVRERLAAMPAAREALWRTLEDARLGRRVDAAAVLAEQTGIETDYDPFAAPADRARQLAAWRARVPAAGTMEMIP